MREILFRGKRLHDNKWIYGNFISDCEGNPHIIEPRFFCEDGHHLQYEDNTDTPVFIIPETVGQFTGLTDKNGKRIFEGDIVRATIERAERCQSPRIENGVIGYDCIGMIGLILYKDKNGENVWSDFFNELSLSGLIEDYYFEIIGNIHDNPELLGGENNGINR